ncbi:TonB-dependent receptor [Rhodobacter capsulatus]|uniref:TonB-dependent receptor n=1 Tax=Rhodobacter capsulatus (strain ATCC BAA-309 / NBRC 16581 / SB1003) TaxID=272942 RepID=D5AVI1_RHOCB|nr:TonB-dependent receptor [Rhodobacter capsulatus]ADE87316.1 TonB-dependent receptor [Rhodobacter capsulatus SB 1003]ETE52158.1 TonB-denpendent receptor [Rhodobacter capsulatus Y262]MDS0926884.1 TonB-dependent receptor [Rhodobacter capsulatus]
MCPAPLFLPPLPGPRHRGVLISVAALALGATPVGLCAQEATNLGTIEISPSHWSETALRSASDATVIDGADLAERNAPDLEAVTARAGNVLFQRANSGERLVVRGLSAFDNALSDPVGYQVNGVALPLGTLQLPHFFAAEQVTLLKGPQGTAFGRNSEAGLLIYDTLRPGDFTGVKLGFGVSGSDAGAQPPGYTASVLWGAAKEGAPALLFGLERSKTDGVISDPRPGGDDDGGREGRTSLLAGAAWAFENGGTLRVSFLGEDETLGKEQYRYIDGPQATGRYESRYSDPSRENRRSSVTSLDYAQTLDGFDLTTITGFTTFDRDFLLDTDSSPLPPIPGVAVTAFDLKDRMISQEIRLSSLEGAERFKWSLGLHAYHQATDVDFDLRGMGARRVTSITQNGVALYGLGEVALTDRLRLGGGLRIDHIASSASQTFSLAGSYAASDATTTPLPKATLAWDISDRTTLHASYARGYMPAGYNYAFAGNAASLIYAPEYSWNAEIGLKTIFLNDASLSLTGFHTTVKDKQITETVVGAVQKISNAAEAESYGLEAALSAPLGHGWQIDGSLGWQHARATSFMTRTGAGPVDYSGNQLPMAPNLSYGLGVTWEGGDGWRARAAVNGYGSSYFDAANTLEQDGYRIVDASISRDLGNGVLTLWAHNLFDEEYAALSLRSFYGTLVEDGQPRSFGLNWTTQW